MEYGSLINFVADITSKDNSEFSVPNFQDTLRRPINFSVEPVSAKQF